MTDLFLVCEELAETTSVMESRPGRRWSLCYPPLAARHLAVSAVEDTRIDVVVLKKEVLRIYLPTTHSRDQLVQEFESAIQTAHSRE
jgi:hypothetical protein